MDSLAERMKTGRSLSANSVRIYTSNLKKMAKLITGDPYENMEFCKEFGKITEYLNTKTIATRRNYIATIIVGCSPEKRDKIDAGFEDIIKKYKTWLILKIQNMTRK